MPTRPGFDLVSVKRETKEQLARLKGEETYDAVIQRLLALGATRAPESKPRDPAEQVALAELAARRWARAVASGRIEERGPRLLVYHLKRPARRRLDVTWSGRRGFSP